MWIAPVTLPLPALEPLRIEARAQGFRFLDRFVAAWESGANRFDRPGECLLGALEGNALRAIGGISHDPYVTGGGTGRLRHLYVVQAERRRGLGSALVARLLAESAGVFSQVRLSTDTTAAARFYERCGFQPLADPHATHAITL